MLETNFRIVEPGVELCLEVRRAQVTGQDLTVDLLNRACDAIRRRYGLAAVHDGESSEILVASTKPVPKLSLDDKDWYLEVSDSGRARVLRFKSAGEAFLLAQLFERGLMARLERETPLWTIKMAPRIFYEPQAFTTAQDVAAYQRFELSSEAIEGVGVGLAVELSTAFFTTRTVADYFRDDLSEEEQERLQERFDRLRNRRGNKMGTLLYDNGKTKTTCYFDSFPRGTTTSSTGVIMVEGHRYSSLADYYKEAHGVTVRGDEPVAKVLFKRPDKKTPKKGLDRPLFVCANMLRLRVMNNSLPGDLKKVDKVVADERARSVSRFWERFDHAPLGKGMPRVSREFWRPAGGRSFRVEHPDLVFGGGHVLRAPRNSSVDAHKEFFRRRQEFLDRYGCYDVPPAVKRVLYVAVPQITPEAEAARAAEDVTAKLSKWVRKKIEWELVPYKTLDDAFSRLRRVADPGLVLFIFVDDDGGEYYLVSHQLKEWRVKRVTHQTLRRKAALLRLSESGNGNRSGAVVPQRALRDWDSFIEMTALDVLQQMDCVPWTITRPLNYPAQLSIDVGEKHRHFALSLLICQQAPADPQFWIDTVPFDKTDLQAETINSTILADAIKIVCQRPVSKRPEFTPLPRLLVVRDGRKCGDELETILGLRDELVRMGFLSESAEIHVVDAHKNSVKGQRLWERCERDGRVRNALEGHAVLLNRRKAVLINTGAATLTQGTAEPVVLKSHDDRVNMRAVAGDFHVTSHFNYSSPGVAQRLALGLKRTDDVLKNRAAQEIKFLQ